LRRIPLTPGRWWALTLGMPLALATIAYGGLSCVALVAHDSFRVQHAIAGTHVTMGLGSGNLTVVPSTSATGYMGVRGVVNYSLVRPKVAWETAGDGTTFVGPSCSWLGWSCGANLTLTVHPATAVTASTGSGDLGVQGLTGPLKLEDGSGDISVADLSGPVAMQAGSGDITGSGLRAPTVQAGDGSGDVHLVFTRPPDDVRINASSGDINLTLPGRYSYRVSAHTSSGSSHIGVVQDPSSHRVIDLEDGSGDINVSSGP
jgi:putative adhesin